MVFRLYNLGSLWEFEYGKGGRGRRSRHLRGRHLKAGCSERDARSRSILRWLGLGFVTRFRSGIDNTMRYYNSIDAQSSQ